jgi:hypothetical protein
MRDYCLNKSKAAGTLNSKHSLNRFILFLSVMLCCVGSSFSQNAYTFFESYQPFEFNSAGRIKFQFDNADFFKNNEYSNPVVKGYTLTGAWIRPKFVYYPDNKLRIEMGGNVLKYNGRDEYFNLQPWFSIQYQPLENLSLIMGNLNNNQNHLLPEFLREPELFLTAKPEAGFQVKYQSRIVSADSWVDWQKFILAGDNFKEHFEFGLSSAVTLLRNQRNKISVPFLITASHTGGEIDTNPALARSFLSITSGFSLRHTFYSSFFNAMGSEDYFSLSTQPQDDPVFNKGKGWGTYLTGYLSSRFGVLTASYWHGHNYYVPQGGYLFQNFSQIDNSLIPDNQLLGLKYHFDKEIFPATHFGVMLDLYYDTINQKSMNSEGLYLILNFGVPVRKGQ